MIRFRLLSRFCYAAYLCAGVSGLLTLNACGNLKEKNYDTQAIAEEINNRKIKRITQAQIDAVANEWGKQVTQTAQQDLNQVLTTALQQYPLEEAAAYCAVNRLPRADSVVKFYKSSLKRASLRDLKQGTHLTKIEQQLLDAYAYNAENNLPQQPNVQRLGDSALLYTSPISVDNQLCLRCHGTVGSDISEADYQKLTARYNLENLSSRKLKDWLGIWSVNFPKREMIKRMDAR